VGSQLGHRVSRGLAGPAGKQPVGETEKDILPRPASKQTGLPHVFKITTDKFFEALHFLVTAHQMVVTDYDVVHGAGLEEFQNIDVMLSPPVKVGIGPVEVGVEFPLAVPAESGPDLSGIPVDGNDLMFGKLLGPQMVNEGRPGILEAPVLIFLLAIPDDIPHTAPVILSQSNIFAGSEIQHLEILGSQNVHIQLQGGLPFVLVALVVGNTLVEIPHVDSRIVENLGDQGGAGFVHSKDDVDQEEPHGKVAPERRIQASDFGDDMVHKTRVWWKDLSITGFKVITSENCVTGGSLSTNSSSDFGCEGNVFFRNDDVNRMEPGLVEVTDLLNGLDVPISHTVEPQTWSKIAVVFSWKG